MKIQDIKIKIKELNYIKDVVEMSKFHVFQKLLDSEKVSQKFFEFSELSRQIIIASQNKYNLNYKKSKSKRTLWILIITKTLLFNQSINNFKKQFFDKFNYSQDELIIVDDDNNQFCKKNNLEPLLSINNFKNQANEISNIIKSRCLNNQVENIILVNSEQTLKIFPIRENNLNIIIDKKTQSFSKYTFFPSIIEILNSLLSIYFFYIINGFAKKSQYDSYKEKFIKHHESLKKIDNSIKKHYFYLRKEQNKHFDEENNEHSKLFKNNKENFNNV